MARRPVRPALVLPLLAVWGWAGPCPAQPLEVVGPTTVPAHKLVRLEARGPADDTTWIVFPIDGADGEKTDKTHYLFTGPPGTYDIVLIGVRGGALTQAKARVTITGATPVPPDPGPGPTPPLPTPVPPKPVPIPPGPLSERARLVADLVRTRVPDTAGRQVTAAALADVYDSVAGKTSRAAALNPTPPDLIPFTTPGGILAETGREVQRVLLALGELDEWRPFFGDLRDWLNGPVTASGVLDEASGHVAVWRDIAAGLRAGGEVGRARIEAPRASARGQGGGACR